MNRSSSEFIVLSSLDTMYHAGLSRHAATVVLAVLICFRHRLLDSEVGLGLGFGKVAGEVVDKSLLGQTAVAVRRPLQSIRGWRECRCFPEQTARKE
ncbi:hypothetical protein [Paraburkholderia sp. BL25I1N1]|uniref:hypothetical protein n=1 Tax=Paraburkholderia sp. BL25I1N1 TaxID=1938804 RepID=UPI0015E603FF|nr:hypothetical protein [Paraburkholderia sp. BL25I1N1]